MRTVPSGVLVAAHVTLDILLVLYSPLTIVRYSFFFFFQAEDGIRDLIVTGVQTCALPISSLRARKNMMDLQIFSKTQNGKNLQVHHILPRSQGGTNDMANLILLCNSCHLRQEWKISRARGSGLLRYRIENAKKPEPSTEIVQQHFAW